MKSNRPSFTKTILVIVVLLLVLAAPLSIAFSPPFREEPNPSAFVDFNGGSFLVDPAQGQTIVPITSSNWSVVENPTSVLSFENDRIYILQAGVRVSINGVMTCTNGSNTWTQIGIVFRNGSGGYLPTSAPVVIPKTPATQLDFFAMTARRTTEADFTGGNPYVQLIARHNASYTLGCSLHMEVNVQ